MHADYTDLQISLVILSEDCVPALPGHKPQSKDPFHLD